MFAHLLSRQEKSLAVPDFPGGQRPFPPLLSWDFMHQLVSSVHSGMGVGQGTGSPAAFHASMQNQPQTTAPAWTDRWMHLERALVILGSRKPQAGVDTPLGAPVQVSRCFRMQSPKDTEKTPAQQEQEHVQFQGCCVGSREPKGSRAPSPPGAAPGRVPTTGSMKRGGC